MHEYIHKHTKLYNRAHIIFVRRKVGKVGAHLLKLNIEHKSLVEVGRYICIVFGKGPVRILRCCPDILADIIILLSLHSRLSISGMSLKILMVQTPIWICQVRTSKQN
jgi:hypothetical protein